LSSCVQQRALQLEAGGADVLLVQVGAQQFLQLVQRLDADALGEVLVDHGGASALMALTLTSKVTALPARWAAW
jgi:hypothetical protein